MGVKSGVGYDHEQLSTNFQYASLVYPVTCMTDRLQFRRDIKIYLDELPLLFQESIHLVTLQLHDLRCVVSGKSAQAYTRLNIKT